VEPIFLQQIFISVVKSTYEKNLSNISMSLLIKSVFRKKLSEKSILILLSKSFKIKDAREREY